MASLGALLEVLKANQAPPTAAALFAASLLSLDRALIDPASSSGTPAARAAATVRNSLLHLAALSSQRAPHEALANRAEPAAAVLAGHLDRMTQTGAQGDDASGSAAAERHGVEALSAVLAAAASAGSMTGDYSAAIAALTHRCLDDRPKIRRAAAGGIAAIFGAANGSGAIADAAAKEVLAASGRLLPAPAVAARRASADPDSAPLRDAITVAARRALLWLGVVERAAPLLTEGPRDAVASHVLALLSLRQPLLSRVAAGSLVALVGGVPGRDAAGAVARGRAASVSTVTDVAKAATEALSSAADDDAAERAEGGGVGPNTGGPDARPSTAASLCQLLETCLFRLAEPSGDQACDAAWQTTAPAALAAAAPLVAGASGGEDPAGRYAAAGLIASALRGWPGGAREVASAWHPLAVGRGIPASAAAAAAKRVASGRGAPSAVERCVAAAASCLQPASWPHGGLGHAAAAAAGALEGIGAALPTPAGGGGGDDDPATALAAPLLLGLGAALSAAFEPDAIGIPPSLAAAAQEAAPACEAALGAALSALGARRTLAVLPLDVAAGLDDAAGSGGTRLARTWMLPILRARARGAGLNLWGDVLVPDARMLDGAARRYRREGFPRRADAARAVELQLFQTLMPCVSWASDLETALPRHGKTLGGALAARPDLRPAVCAAIERCCWQVAETLGLGTASTAATAGESDDGPSDEGDDDNNDIAPSADNLGRAAAAADHAVAPAGYGRTQAEASLRGLRATAPALLPILLNAFLQSEPAERGPLGAAIAALSAVAEEAQVAGLFRACLAKLMRAVQESKRAESGGDMDEGAPSTTADGGATPLQRRCALTDLCICLAPGLGAQGRDALLRLAAPGLSDSEPAVQKRSYRALAWLVAQTATDGGGEDGTVAGSPSAQDCLELLADAAAGAHSASRRHRLAVIAALAARAASGKSGLRPPRADALATAAKRGLVSGKRNADDSTADAAGADAVLTSLMAEIVLGLKEGNRRTRMAAYAAVVDVGRAAGLDDPDTAHAALSLNAGPDGAPAPPADRVLAAVLAGLVGQTPHFVSATVMALARLLYAYPAALRPRLPRLLPAVLSLLRGKSREVTRAVLGFCKATAVRLPREEVEASLPQMLEGLLVWADDPKNRFRQRVRAVVVTLSQRVGAETVERAAPEGAPGAKLVAHVRREEGRKVRQRERERDRARSARGKPGRKGGEGEGSLEDEIMAGGGSSDAGRSRGGASRATRGGQRGAMTARASEWDASAVFSRGGTTILGGARRRWAPPGGPNGVASGAKAADCDGAGGPLDLLDPLGGVASGGSRRKAYAVRGSSDGDGGDAKLAEMDEAGRLVVWEEGEEGGLAGARTRDEKAATKENRRRGHRRKDQDDDEEDEDGGMDVDEASRGGRSRATVGGRSLGRSTVGGATLGGRSGVTSTGGRSSITASGRPKSKFQHHDGQRFRGGKGAAGDARGNASVEPYAYWPLDRRLLNRRTDKQREGRQVMRGVVAAAGGVKKGAKATGPRGRAKGKA